MTNNQAILIVQQSAPYSSSNSKEALDFALAAATFDQPVQILFIGDACYQLLANQNPESIQQKNLSKMLKALPIYGVEEIMVDMSLSNHSDSNLLDSAIPTRLVSKAEIKSLYKSAKSVFRF